MFQEVNIVYEDLEDVEGEGEKKTEVEMGRYGTFNMVGGSTQIFLLTDRIYPCRAPSFVGGSYRCDYRIGSLQRELTSRFPTVKEHH